MGLFTRRAPDPEPGSWHPDGSGVSARRTYDQDGPDCVVGADAFGARFILDDAPESAITVWAYPIEAGDGYYPGSYRIGYRVECAERWPDHIDPYEENFLASDDDDEFWDDLSICLTACRTVAEDVALGDGDAMPSEVFERFDWDGAILSLSEGS
jgi:hypothetical protein